MKGGVALSQGTPSCLRFSLEESVWFQKGQEVSELISISLDPDILIQENDQYVTIQGALELSGEYKRYFTAEKETEDSFIAPKFIQVVEERDEGICEFTHFFPVDITIPNNRIQSIQEIDVSVESFDYVFPERSCMKLTANLTISGLYGEQQHAAVREEDRVDEQEYPSAEEAVELNWDFKLDETSDESFSPLAETNKDDMYNPFEAVARKPAEQVEEEQYEPSFTVPRSDQSKPIQETVFEKPVHNESSSSEESIDVIMEEESSESESSDQPTVKKETAVDKIKKKITKKKSMSLTEFFARKSEDDVARLKVCIVQNGDTVDMIAERYDIPVHRLLSVNHLELNQDIYEGQVLYIPVAIAQK